MPSYLVIVESPGKIKKLKSILGSDYHIIASMGHVVDLPATEFGINVSTMQPAYVIQKADTANKIKAEAQKTWKMIYLASDPDREGEAISYHIATLIRKANPQAQTIRVTFDAITPSAVKAAFQQPRPLNTRLVAAQETRRLLDRLVGFPASRFLWQFVRGKSLSAGRVQSVALRLVVERDRAIANFVPEEYWTIMGLFRAAKGEFSALLAQWKGKKPVLKNQADTQAVLDALKGVPFRIRDVTPKQRQQKPPAPFITSSLQQAASSHLKMSPDTTMKIAQSLYEDGHITYMRTDSPSVSPEGAAMAKETIRALYGEKYLGSGGYSAKGGAQEAHECVRPTDTNVTRDQIGDDRAAALYDLIYKRFLASQMANAVYNEVHVSVVGGEALFRAKGSTLIFDGFLRVYGLTEEKETVKRADDESDDETTTNKQLPELKAGENVEALKLTPTQHFTKPPSPYTEALLIKALEQNGVGRPSTYAQTVATIKKRNYVEVEKRQLHATNLGKEVHQVLDSKLVGMFEVPFTAQMETALDDIAEGKQNGRDYLLDFWAKAVPLFGQKIVDATLTAVSKAKRTSRTPNATGEKPTRRPRRTAKPTIEGETKAPRKRATAVPAWTTGEVCPTCGKPLVQRTGKKGAFVGCTGFPKCRYTRNV